MCAVSVITDYYSNTRWTDNGYPPLTPIVPPIIRNDPEALEMLRRAIEILEKIDQKLGDTDCKDEIKKPFLDDLNAR